MYNKSMNKFSFKTVDKRFLLISLAALVLLVFVSTRFDQGLQYPQENLPSSYHADFDKLIINEVVTSNKGVYANGNNVAADYLELYNASSTAINLKGYGLSDDERKIKWSFPDVTIRAHGYLVVSLSGEKSGDPLEANFRLSSSKSERIILTNPQAKIIDAVDTVPLAENHCLARDSEGQWVIYDICTPGYENSLAGLEKYYDSILALDENDGLKINEFMARNKGNYVNETHDDTGFIEFKNTSSEPINLSEYRISNERYIPFARKLPEVILNPGEIVCFNLGKNDYFRTDCLGINFPSGSGSIYLSKNGKIIREFTYRNLNSGNALARLNGTQVVTSVVSPGYENDAEGIKAFQLENMVTPEDLIINEVMNRNATYLVHNGGNAYDWIELYNNTKAPIRLAEYYLSNTDDNYRLFQLPDVILEPQGYYIIMCSGDPNLSTTSYVHANFKIGQDAALYLSHYDELVDAIHVSRIPFGYSYGRGSTPGLFYLVSPTPYKENTTGYRSVSNSASISLPGGIYNQSEPLIVSVTGPGDIYYTLDGSEPTTRSAKINGDLTITRTCVLKTKTFTNGMIASQTTTDSYIVNENHAVNVISISLASSDFSSINNNPGAHDYVKQAYVEYFDESGGFESECGLCLYGDDSRYYRKKNYAMRFDKAYATGNLHYQVFKDRDNAEYDTLAIRAGGQVWDSTIINDTLLTTLIDDTTDVPTYACVTVVCYINGQYWGLYTLKEKKNGNFLQETYNVPKETFNMVQSTFILDMGSSAGYRELVNYCHNHNLSNDQYYQYVADRIDVEEWCDYWIGQMFAANIDYCNVRFFNSPQLDNGKWKILFYDLDYSMNEVSYNSYTRAFCRYGGFWNNWWDSQGFHDRVDNVVILSLFENAQFRKLWLKRLKYNLETTWNTERVLQRLDELAAEYQPEIARDRRRWNCSVSEFNSGVEKIRRFVSQRPKYMLSTTQSYFGLSNAEMKEWFGDLYG